MISPKIGLGLAALLVGLAVGTLAAQAAKSYTLTHVSFDTSPELIKALDDGFIDDYQKKNSAVSVGIRASHAGSSRQVQALVNGFPAELVTMNQFIDMKNIHVLSKGSLLAANWQSLLPNKANPFNSTMVFVARAGNPKGIRDWADLTKPGLHIVVPNLKTTGNGRYTYLSAYAWAKDQFKDDQAKIRSYVKKVLGNIPIQANGGRDATTLFDERKQGDILITFEAEARQIEKKKPGQYVIIVPSFGLLTEMYGATIEKNARASGTLAVTKAYWDFVFSPAGQEIIARNFYRPINPQIAQKYQKQLPPLRIVSFESVFGSWEKVDSEQFGTNGIYDQIFRQK